MNQMQMNKSIIPVLMTAFLLACNALIPSMTESDSETITPPPTESVLQQPSDTKEIDSTGFTTVRLRPGDGNLQTMLAQEVHKAIALNLMPIVEFDATWCPPCQAIDEALESGNELMLKAYAGTYVIKLDVDEWGWSDSSLHDFDFDGIPVYFKLDAQGHPTGETIDGNAWGDNIPENIAPPMDEFFHGE